LLENNLNELLATVLPVGVKGGRPPKKTTLGPSDLDRGSIMGDVEKAPRGHKFFSKGKNPGKVVPDPNELKSSDGATRGGSDLRY